VTEHSIWNETAHSPEAELSRQSRGHLRCGALRAVTVAAAGGAGILSGAAKDTVRANAPPPHSGLPGAVREGDRSPLEACAAVRTGEAPCHLKHPRGAGDWGNPQVRREYCNVTGLNVSIAGFAELGHSRPEERPVLFG
jgi:hypothetical protein